MHAAMAFSGVLTIACLGPLLVLWRRAAASPGASGAEGYLAA